MKKLLYIFFLCGLSLMSFAQEEELASEEPKSKKVSNEYLPSSGDIAIGVDALPYLEFLGNMFSGHDARNSINVGSTTIYGKYYVDADAALRFEVHLNNSVDNNKNYVQDDANVAQNPNAQVEDFQKIKFNNWGIGLGYQLYRGYGKLRGTYGVTASYFRTSRNTEYQWGNQMSASNATPSSTNWYGAGVAPAQRNLEVKDFGSQTASIGLIGGVEYFFVPKICIGGEFGIYYGYTWNSQENLRYERVDQGEVREYDLATDPKDSFTSITTRVYDANNVAGRLYVLFHF